MSDDLYGPVLALKRERPLGDARQSLIPFPPKKDFPIFTQRYSCDDPPEGKHPALGCLVFLQICRPSRKPKINMRKTARINLAACAEKLGVSMIAPTYFLEKKKRR